MILEVFSNPNDSVIRGDSMQKPRTTSSPQHRLQCFPQDMGDRIPGASLPQDVAKAPGLMQLIPS